MQSTQNTPKSPEPSYRDVFTRGAVCSLILAAIIAWQVYEIGWTAFQAHTVASLSSPGFAITLLFLAGIAFSVTITALQLICITLMRLIDFATRRSGPPRDPNHGACV